MKERRKNVGVVLGHNCDPLERVRRDRVTHACWHDDGSVSLVHGDAEGYAPGELVKLPKGYSEKTHEADHKSRTFVLRSAPLAPALDLHERVRLLEQQVAEFLENDR